MVVTGYKTANVTPELNYKPKLLDHVYSSTYDTL